MIARKLAAMGGVAALLAVGGCVSLFPKSEPAQLYRFGVAPSAGSQSPAPERAYNVSRSTTVFNRAALSDRILTVSGSETAYIAGARWVSPAIILFDEALSNAFDAAPGCARLVSRGDPAVPDALLRVEVKNFEARYLDGPEAAPTAFVDARVSMISSKDRRVIAEQTIHAEQRASENRVSAIVAAIDTATGQVLDKVVGLAGSEAARQGCGAGTAATSSVSRTTTVTSTVTR